MSRPAYAFNMGYGCGPRALRKGLMQHRLAAIIIVRMDRRLLSALSRIDTVETHTFFPGALPKAPLVIDLGANRGEFSLKLSRRYGARCLAVEANPALYADLMRHSGDDRVSFFSFAVAGRDEPVTLHVSADITSSSITGPRVPDPRGTVEVSGKTLETFLHEQGVTGTIDLMKVDIEGAELGLFAGTCDAAICRVRQITIEFHDDHGFMTRDDFEQIRDRLKRLGFRGIKFSPNNTNWLFFRPELVGPLQETYVRYIVRNLRGVLRRLGLRAA